MDIAEQIRFVARVIYSEASPICDMIERELVASVIANRRRHLGFGLGKLRTMYDVVIQPNAFSCIGDIKNKNWIASEAFECDLEIIHKDTSIVTPEWEHSLYLANAYFVVYDDIVYYHDKSIDMPKSWNNRWWKSIFVRETSHFKFYKVVENTDDIV